MLLILDLPKLRNIWCCFLQQKYKTNPNFLTISRMGVQFIPQEMLKGVIFVGKMENSLKCPITLFTFQKRIKKFQVIL